MDHLIRWGVLKAGCKQFDLFGVIIIAIATGLGGGSLRDMLLDRDVFWIHDQSFFIASLASAVIVFLMARVIKMSPRLFLIPDAQVWQPSAWPVPWCH